MKQLTTIIGAAFFASSAVAQSPNIVGYEYWFDQNDAGRSYVPVSPVASINISDAPLNINGLSLGQHMAHFRLKDQQGSNVRWSSVVTRGFSIGQPAPWEIVAVRYWHSNLADPPLGTDMRYRYFDTPQTEVSYTGLLDLCNYPIGPQVLKLQLLDGNGQWSSVVTRPVQITATGVLGVPTITASTTTYCPGEEVTFTAIPISGPGAATPTGYEWLAPTGNGWSTQQTNSNTFSVIIGNTNGTVQVAATNYCGSSSAASFAVSIPEPPSQPGDIAGPLQACAGGTAVFSVPPVPGTTYEWVLTGGWTANGGPGSSLTTTVGNTDATITVTPFNACGIAGLARTAAIVVNQPPDAGQDGTLTICSTDNAASLFDALEGDPEVGGLWSGPSPTLGQYDPATMEPGSYVYTVSGAGGCADASATVQVTEPAPPSAGLDATLALCSNVSPVNMTAALGGAPNAGGTWTGPSATNGAYDPASMEPGIYTYTVSGTAPCPNASALLTVTEILAPNAGIGGNVALCANDPPFALFSYLIGNPNPGGLWRRGGINGPAFSGIFNPAIDADGSFTYIVAGFGPCAFDTATLVVNTMDLELEGIAGPPTVDEIDIQPFIATPFPADADSFSWTFPADWTLSFNDPMDNTIYLIPPAQAGVYSICATAHGGGCTGNEVCFTTEVTVGLGHHPDANPFDLGIFPNPNDGHFWLRGAGPSEVTAVHVLNALGQEVAAFDLEHGNPYVDMSHLTPGTYTLRWTTKAQSGARTFVVAR